MRISPYVIDEYARNLTNFIYFLNAKRVDPSDVALDAKEFDADLARDVRRAAGLLTPQPQDVVEVEPSFSGPDDREDVPN